MQLEWRGIRVYITREGDSGRGVLLLHGWMCSADMMSDIQHTLSDKIHCWKLYSE